MSEVVACRWVHAIFDPGAEGLCEAAKAAFVAQQKSLSDFPRAVISSSSRGASSGTGKPSLRFINSAAFMREMSPLFHFFSSSVVAIADVMAHPVLASYLPVS